MRKLPSTSKPPIPALIHWFYTEYLGVKPDRHVYSRFNSTTNKKSLVPILAPERLEDDGIEVEGYSVTDCAELVYYLEDQGVEVDTLGIVAIEGLMFSYVNRNKLESAKRQLDSTVSFLRGDKINGKRDGEFDAPSGW